MPTIPNHAALPLAAAAAITHTLKPAVIPARRSPRQPRRHRVALRPWGFTECEAAGLLPGLPDLDARLEWALASKALPRPDIVVHLIDAARLSGVSGGARWNAMGPSDAMRKATQLGRTEIALVVGSTCHLPARRHGCWILSGARSLVSALRIVARSAIEPLLVAADRRPWSIHDLAAMNALCILAQENATDVDTLARRVTRTVDTALNVGLAAPARVLVAADPDVMDYVVSLNPLMRERMHLFRRHQPEAARSAEVLVAYPWPDAPATLR